MTHPNHEATTRRKWKLECGALRERIVPRRRGRLGRPLVVPSPPHRLGLPIRRPVSRNNCMLVERRRMMTNQKS
eukprot:3259895-Rhodomonas_salina.1